MDKRAEKITLTTIGIFFIFVSIGSITNSTNIFWLCYLTTFLIGISCILKKPELLLSQIYILAIPLLFWNIDFFYHLLTSNPLWNITNYFFETTNFTIQNFFTLQHIITIPLSIYALTILKPKLKNTLKIAFSEVLIVYLLTRLINPTENINCILEPCLKIPFQIPFYQIAWLIGYATIILLTFFTTKQIIKK